MFMLNILRTNSLANLVKLGVPEAKSTVVNYIKGVSKEELVLREVYEKANEGDPESVIKVIDNFGWKQQFLMVICKSNIRFDR